MQGRAPDVASKVTQSTGAQTEEDRIAAMFQAGAEQWDKQQQEMAKYVPSARAVRDVFTRCATGADQRSATPVYHRPGPAKGKPATGAVPANTPPSGYICYRCGEKGHWIQECPTNDDPQFDNRPRVKRTTGIPRSFLKTIEKPAALSNDGLTDTSHQPSGVMVNAEGDFVIAEPDKASWDQYQAKTKASAAAQEAAKTGSKELQDRAIECPIDKVLFVEPMKTPCCQKTYCNDCITNALIESDLTCPGCQSEGILIDNLVADDEATDRVKSYMAEKETKRHRVDAETEREAPEGGEENSESRSRSPNPAQASTTKTMANGTSKKRAADDEIDGERATKASTTVQSQGPSDPGFPAGLPNMGPNMNFPMMPFDPMMGMNHMGLAGGNGFMGMPMTMDPMMGHNNAGMMNPMMGNGFGGNMGGFNNGMGGFNDYAPPLNGVYGAGGYGGGGMMPNGGYGAQSAMYVGNGNATGPAGMAMNMPYAANGMQAPGGMAMNGGFAGQGVAGSGGASMQEDDNAYFRKPVNPHRHQARQRRMRPSDYHEL